MGKNVEHFKAAAVAADQKGGDRVLRYCAVGRQLGYAAYLTLDMGTYVSWGGVFLWFFGDWGKGGEGGGGVEGEGEGGD